MTKEFIIHLVKNDNQGQSLEPLNNQTLMTIAKTFGGFTVTEGRGGWVNSEGKLYDEPILGVTIACDNTPEQSALIKAIALDYKQEANQEAVYVRAIDGDVVFI